MKADETTPIRMDFHMVRTAKTDDAIEALKVQLKCYAQQAIANTEIAKAHRVMARYYQREAEGIAVLIRKLESLPKHKETPNTLLASDLAEEVDSDVGG